MRTIFMIVIALGMLLSASGCATVFVGYENTVLVANLPPDAKIYDSNGEELAVRNLQQKKKMTVIVKNVLNEVDTTVNTELKYVELRSNEDHLLTIRTAEGERKIRRYPKLSAGWFALGVVTGTFFVDWYTGNWNHFDNIDYRAE